MIEVEINEQEYRNCNEYSLGDNFWGNSKSGSYGIGLGRTQDDPYKPARTGLLAEFAFSKLLNIPFDFSYQQFGDKQDFLLFEKYKIDIKCAMKNTGKCLIYHTSENGKQIPLNKDIYILSYIGFDNRNEASIRFVGFISKEDVQKCPVCPGYKGGKHMNYEVYFNKTKPIEKFVELCSKFFKKVVNV